MKNLSALITTFLLLQLNTFAQAPDTLWTKIYGGANSDRGNSVQQTNDEGYIITGVINSGYYGGKFVLIKTDNNGDTLWCHIDTVWSYSSGYSGISSTVK